MLAAQAMCTWKGCCWARGALLGTQGTLGAATLLAARPEAMPVALGILSIDMVLIAGLAREGGERGVGPEFGFLSGTERGT